ncbi:restriction endonuclease subunit S [Dehalococcoides mccartyi]|uniref:Restriction endonuclease subunit S n=1 Tax=Dehalococcoides mccartyi TaxID=61435 RepID=A0AB38Z8Y1_9CHLR|nr:restriction endonuclease subunit S [Dehalococcoides mccartyi]WRO07061.1 restriction endonuclease subunit S [Dehalococcoides mccartyi]
MSEWKECTLGDYAKVLGGYAFKSGDFGASGDFPVIKIKNVASGLLDMAGCQFISSDVANNAVRFRAKRGDILIAMTGSHIHQPSSMVGKVTRYSTDEIAYINQRVGKVYSMNSDELDEDFLFYFLKWDETTYGLALSAGGSANQANISAGQIEGLQILLPSVDEQRLVSEVLLSIDDKITLLSNQNATLEALAKTHYQQWFVIDAAEPNGTLGEILVENEKSKIQVGEARNQSGDYPFFTSGVAILRYKDFLVDGRNIYLNTGGVADVKYLIGKAAYSTDTWSINADIFTDYVYMLLSGMVEEINNNYFMGTALQHLQKPKMRAMPIYIPSDEEILEFNDIVCPLFDKRESNKRQIYTLQKLRDTLLPKLISGEVRVKQ